MCCQRAPGPESASAPIAEVSEVRSLAGSLAGGRSFVWFHVTERLGGPVDDLTPYDRATVNLWSRSYREVVEQSGHGPLVEAALHGVLAGLRTSRDVQPLFVVYEANAAADFALIRSLVTEGLPEELVWKVRDAAFHLRWLELTRPA